MAQAPQLDFDGFVARRKSDRSTGGIQTTGHEYTYTFDRQSREAFESTKPVAYAVEASVRLFKQMGKHQLLGNAVRVSDREGRKPKAEPMAKRTPGIPGPSACHEPFGT